jgi:hypothetical protein
MFSSWDAGCRHFFHLVDRVSQARTCALAGDKETLNFAKVGLAARGNSSLVVRRSLTAETAAHLEALQRIPAAFPKVWVPPLSRP